MGSRSVARAPRQLALEARILSAMGDGTSASALLWRGFEATLDAELLRAHLKILPDFDAIQAEERAMALAYAFPDGLKAVRFFMDWPRRDLAAAVVVARHDEWNGHDWYVLPDLAQALQHEYPLAATILYRALLDDILARARSKAYRHGARYLATLELIAAEAEDVRSWPGTMKGHAEYLAGLHSAHKRKVGFWNVVKMA